MFQSSGALLGMGFKNFSGSPVGLIDKPKSGYNYIPAQGLVKSINR